MNEDEYLEKLIAEAAPQLEKITDPEAWLAEVRGYEPPRREVITIEPPRRDKDGEIIKEEFETPVRVEVRGGKLYIEEKKMFLSHDLEHIVETVKMLVK